MSCWPMSYLWRWMHRTVPMSWMCEWIVNIQNIWRQCVNVVKPMVICNMSKEQRRRGAITQSQPCHTWGKTHLVSTSGHTLILITSFSSRAVWVYSFSWCEDYDDGRIRLVRCRSLAQPACMAKCWQLGIPIRKSIRFKRPAWAVGQTLAIDSVDILSLD